MMSGGLSTNNMAPSPCIHRLGVTSCMSSAPKAPWSANESTSHMPMNWNVAGSHALNGLNTNAARGIESVRPTDPPTGHIR